jgi:hypothetical protein
LSAFRLVALPALELTVKGALPLPTSSDRAGPAPLLSTLSTEPAKVPVKVLRALTGLLWLRWKRPAEPVCAVALDTTPTSRATILTGRYAHNHGVRDNEPIRGGFATFHDNGLEQRTVAVRLREAGYRTALFGKLLNGYCNPDQGCETGRDYVPPGWTDWHAWSGSRILNDNGTLHDFPDDSLVKDDVVRARVSRLLESWSASKPLFLYVSAKAPHGGTDVAERHASLFAEESLDRGGLSTRRTSRTNPLTSVRAGTSRSPR